LTCVNKILRAKARKRGDGDRQVVVDRHEVLGLGRHERDRGQRGDGHDVGIDAIAHERRDGARAGERAVEGFLGAHLIFANSCSRRWLKTRSAAFSLRRKAGAINGLTIFCSPRAAARARCAAPWCACRVALRAR
jgi:hypothetical protein